MSAEYGGGSWFVVGNVGANLCVRPNLGTQMTRIARIFADFGLDIKGMKMRLKFIFLLLFSLWGISKTFASGRANDGLLYDGVFYTIFYNYDLQAFGGGYPLEPLIREWRSDSLRKHKLDAFEFGVTWMRNGYVADWEIRNDSLILNRVWTGHFARPHQISLDFLFPDRDTENGVFADWFSGRLFLTTRWNLREDIVLVFAILDGKILGKRDRRNPIPLPADTVQQRVRVTRIN